MAMVEDSGDNCRCLELTPAADIAQTCQDAGGCPEHSLPEPSSAECVRCGHTHKRNAHTCGWRFTDTSSCECKGPKPSLEERPLGDECPHIGSRVTGGSSFPHRVHFACSTCGATWTRTSGDVPEQPEEPPLTPEEEEEAPEDVTTLPPPQGPEYTPCLDCEHIEPDHHEAGIRNCMKCACLGYRIAPPPPQPERRPPLLVAYSVQGHLYEVALSGDAVARAVDGALVITHPLGPVAGICQVAPYASKEST